MVPSQGKIVSIWPTKESLLILLLFTGKSPDYKSLCFGCDAIDQSRFAQDRLSSAKYSVLIWWYRPIHVNSFQHCTLWVILNRHVWLTCTGRTSDTHLVAAKRLNTLRESIGKLFSFITWSTFTIFVAWQLLIVFKEPHWSSRSRQTSTYNLFRPFRPERYRRSICQDDIVLQDRADALKPAPYLDTSHVHQATPPHHHTDAHGSRHAGKQSPPAAHHRQSQSSPHSRSDKPRYRHLDAQLGEWRWSKVSTCHAQ